MKKAIVVMMILAVITASVFAQAASEAASEEKVVTIIQDANYANQDWFKQMNEAFEAETGIKVDYQFSAATGNDFNQKLLIDLMAGSDVDVIPLQTFRYYNAEMEGDFLAPLSQYIKDADKIWGSNLIYEADGEFYAVPTKQEIYVVFYNKDLFDKAGLDYPKAPWTWDDMIATAEKLSDPANGIYGLYLDRYGSPWGFLPGRQNDIPMYKEDGTSNFDDPRMVEAVSKVLELDQKKIAMPYQEVLAGGASWNYYAIIGGKVGMYTSLNFMTRELNNVENYGRDWRYGVVAMPSAGEKIDLANLSYAAMNRNAKHPQAAATYIAWVGQNQWKYEKGIPALATLSAEDQTAALASIADGSHGSVTVDELYEAYFNTGNERSIPAEFAGPSSKVYYDIITEELRALHLGTTATVEEAVSKIVSRANEAIANAQ
ncbi:MAG: extracellular solute-binding protein [Spirochaetales bacterium]|nr:extracellular solute-binding protein [Spirochaetales bacterium]